MSPLDHTSVDAEEMTQDGGWSSERSTFAYRMRALSQPSLHVGVEVGGWRLSSGA